jgi:P-type E1-E2 ATPase
VIGAEHAIAETVPERKAEFVKSLQDRGFVVAMVGDGINDAPALAQADLSIGMGSGADIALKAVSAVLIVLRSTGSRSFLNWRQERCGWCGKISSGPSSTTRSGLRWRSAAFSIRFGPEG